MKSWRQPSFVFVHGGDHGSWCWAQVQRHLTRPSLAVDLPVVRLVFCNDMSPANRRLMLDRMTPEAMGLVVERVHNGAVMNCVPMTFIEPGRGRVVRPPRQDTAIANLGSGVEVLHLHTGHDAKLSRPAELAAAIENP
jgi:hypothetical protein